MKKFFPLILILMVGCGNPILVDTFGNISGTVQDAQTVSPLDGVTVGLTPTGFSQVTGRDGSFQFDNLDVQEYTLTFNKEGYQAQQQKVTVKPGLSSSVQVSLKVADVIKATVVIGSISGLSDYSVRLHATLSSMGSSIITQHGFCYATHRNPTTQDNCTELGELHSVGAFMEDISGLTPTTTYYCRAYAENGAGIAYSEEISFMTTSSGPSVIWGGVTDITSSSARVVAQLTSLGSSAVTEHGFCYAEHEAPTKADFFVDLGSASSTGQVVTTIQGLKASTIYYCRAYAQNSSGLFFSNEASFTTSQAGTVGSEDIAIPNGLMFYLTFDSEEVKDMTDNNYEAIVFGEPTYLTDTPNGNGKSLFLNGTKGQYINIPYSLFDNLNNYSITFWAKDFSSGSFVTGISSVIATMGNAYSSFNRPKVYLNSDAKLIFDTYGRSVQSTGSTTAAFNYPFTQLQYGEWHHIAVTMELVSWRNVKRCLYIDGLFVDTLEDDDCSQTMSKIQIGGNAEGGYPLSMTTKIDNVRFYSKTLSKDEIKAIYNSEQ